MAGRPRTLDREHALATALEGYWRVGIYGMSVNEVCRRAEISKPGLYREFGGEDGLLAAVLGLYDETVLTRVRAHLAADLSFNASMRLFIQSFFDQSGHPPGCLLAEFRLAYDDLGELTRAVVDQTVRRYRTMFSEWLARRRDMGEIAPDIDPDHGARYLDSQLFLAATQAHRGGDLAKISERFMMAIHALEPKAAS